MNIQPPGKNSVKRKGKQISAFGERVSLQQEPFPQTKNGLLYATGSNVQISDGGLNPHSAESKPLNGSDSVLMDSEKNDINRLSQKSANQTVPMKWTQPVSNRHSSEKSNVNWQLSNQGSSWTPSTSFGAKKVAMSSVDSSAPGPFVQTYAKQRPLSQLPHESFQRHPDAAVNVSQLGLFGDAIKQITEKAQLAQKQAVTKQQVDSLSLAQQIQYQQHPHHHQQQILQQQRQHQQTQHQPIQHHHQQTHVQLQQQQTLVHHQQQTHPQHHEQTQPQHQNHQQTQIQSQHQHFQQQTQPQQQTQHQHLQLTQSQHHQQIQSQHQQQIQLPNHQQTQIQPQHQHHQQQTQPQQQTQHHEQQTQHHHQQIHPQQNQHQNQHQLQLQHQEQQHNEALPHHPFYQFPYDQQRQDLPPNTVMKLFRQSQQPLYSHPTQNMSQQQIFQKFFPHQQPPQSLGLQRLQASRMPDPSQPQVQSIANQFQQFADAQVSQGLQKVLVCHKQEPPPIQAPLKFQAQLPNRVGQACKKNVKTSNNTENIGNPSLQHWPQAFGPELQKLLNVPLEHHSTLSLRHKPEVDLLQTKNKQWQGQANQVKHLSQRENNTTQPAQNGRKQQGTTTQKDITGEEVQANCIIQSTPKTQIISNDLKVLQAGQRESPDNWNRSVKGKPAQEKRKVRAAGNSKVIPQVADSTPSTESQNEGSLMPLIIPVSVPVKKENLSTTNNRKGESKDSSDKMETSEQGPSSATRKRRSSRGAVPEPSAQNNDGPRRDENLSAKLKRRPRPEPLFIPPKPLNHVSVITYPPGAIYQSNLRSPVRLLDHHPMDRNFQPPPYTPPPILSPMREGSGLYFNAFLSSQPVTPKSTTKTYLYRSKSAETPPVLSNVNDATPACIEPQINIGPRFQAEIPRLQDRSLAALDDNHADLVWKPWEELGIKHLTQQTDDLLNLSCSSVLSGGGTNQELALHCLHESKGNVVAALNMLLLRRTPRARSQVMSSYHYAGSDKWTVTEKRLFNRGLATHKKDFFLVQKLVKTKTVAQCVEFYYTYKKQVKISRNGMLVFGDSEVCSRRNVEEQVEVDRKDSLHRKCRIPLPLDIEWESEEEDESADGKPILIPLKVTQAGRASEVGHDVRVRRNHDPTYRSSCRQRQPAAVARPLPPTGDKLQPDVLAKRVKQDQENTFPCKKCGKVFSKVKSRSAHMKSHSVQEKKQREAEEQEAESSEHTKDQEELDDLYYYYDPA
eukprot:gi/632951644/ref/XP_007891413.1/ PREDICTED: ELM2 and SANT domain-containing protein 1 isoform X2 [Callorhinchus milii]